MYKVSLWFCLVAASGALALHDLVDYPSLRLGGDCYPNVIEKDTILADPCSLPLASSALYPSLYSSGCGSLSPLAPYSALGSLGVLSPYGYPGYGHGYYGYKSGYPGYAYDGCKGGLATEIIAPEIVQQTIVEKAPTVAYTTIESVEPACAPATVVVSQPEIIKVGAIDAGCGDGYYGGLYGGLYGGYGGYGGLYGDLGASYAYGAPYGYAGKGLLGSPLGYPLAAGGKLLASSACDPCATDVVTVSKEPCAVSETVVEVEPLQTITKEIIETVPATVVSEVETPVVYTSGYRSTSESYFSSAVPQKTRTIVYQEPTITEVVSVTNPIIPVVEQEIIEAPACNPCDDDLGLGWGAGPWGYGSLGYGGYGSLGYGGYGPWGHGGYGPWAYGAYGPWASGSYLKGGPYLSGWSYGNGWPLAGDWPLLGDAGLKGAALYDAPLITETTLVKEAPIVKEAIVKEVPYKAAYIAPYHCSPCA